MKRNRTREPEEILTSREAREFLKIGRTKLWELTHQRSIPAYRVGSGKTSGLRYKRSELLAWLDHHRISSQELRAGATAERR
jgi:excisionase family DNA binding protein